MPYRSLFSLKKREAGSSLVDAAIVMPILGAVVFGIIQMGYILASYITLRNASAAGARWGIVNTSLNSTDFRNGIVSAVNASMLPLDTGLVTVTETLDNGVTPPRVTVALSYSLPLFPGSRLVLGSSGNFTMTTQTTMR